jgi:hypothetical protein
MSRVFLILSLPHPGSHGKPSVGLQTRIAETDMYGAFSLNSLAPAAREEHRKANPGPTQDRFGFQVRTYKSSTSLALIINTVCEIFLFLNTWVEWTLGYPLRWAVIRNEEEGGI